MIGAASPDDLLPLRLAIVIVVLPRDLDRGFDGFGPAGTEERRGLIARRDLREARCQLDRRDRGGLGRAGIGEGARLARHRVADLLAAMADIDQPEPRQRIDILVPVDILDHHAFAFDENFLSGILSQGVEGRAMHQDVFVACLFQRGFVRKCLHVDHGGVPIG